MAEQSQTSRIIDESIRRVVRPMLKGYGFRKSGRTFHAPKGPFVTVIHFQSSIWNNPDEARFTINLRVTTPFYHRASTSTDFPKNPAKADALVDQRIGLLMPESSDYWWEVQADTDPDELGNSVADALENFGLPFLENYADEQKLIETLAGGHELPRVASNQHMDYAILLAATGRLDAAKPIIDAQKEVARSEDNDLYEKNLDRLWTELRVQFANE